MEIQRNAPNLSGAQPCPNCGTTIARNATLCVHCGYNLQTGEKTRRQISRKRLWLGLLVLLLAGIGLGILVWQSTCATPAPRQTTAEAIPTESATPTPAPTAPAPVATDDFAERKAAAIASLQAKLDADEPLFQMNETVELRRKNGQVHRGTFSGLAGEGEQRVALIAGASGEIGVPVNQLDAPSRRRVDPDYRAEYIRWRMSAD